MNFLSRRTALGALAGFVLRGETAEQCWTRTRPLGRDVYSRGVGPPLVVLHEIGGLSPATFDLGGELAEAGFSVHLPLLFGHAFQDNVALGYFEACWGSFACRSTHKSGGAGRYVQDLAANLAGGTPAIAVIGMCLSGGLPLETMYPGSKVRAVVLSQPALPFGAANQQSIGVSESVLQAVRASATPLLGLRFREDTLCTSQRFDFLDSRFPGQFERLEIEGPPCFHQTWTHRLHAVLTGPFPEQRAFARKRMIEFLQKHLTGTGNPS